MSHRVLIIEDNPQMSGALKRSLQSFCKVEQVPTLSGACNHVCDATVPYDAVVVDRVLPDGDGLDVLEFIRHASPQTLICVLSSQAEASDMILGLKQGADCYLPKPMTPELFRWHFSALLKRGHRIIPPKIQFGELELETELRIVRSNHGSCLLTQRESQMLTYGMNHPLGRVSHENLREMFPHSYGERPQAATHITARRLKRKLESIGFTLVSRYGVGYQLAPRENISSETV